MDVIENQDNDNGIETYTVNKLTYNIIHFYTLYYVTLLPFRFMAMLLKQARMKFIADDSITW
jgi:hypothetical protein